MKRFSKVALLAFGFGLFAVLLSPIFSRRSAAADDIKTVIVGNTVATPVLVGDVDNPAHDPVVGTCTFNGAGACIISFKDTMSPNLTTSVPFGYELVIEYISGNFALHAGDLLARTYVQTAVNGNSTNGYVVPVKTATDGVLDYYSFGQTTRLYGDPGNAVSYFVGDLSANPVTLDSFNVSGYLVKCGTGAACPALP